MAGRIIISINASPLPILSINTALSGGVYVIELFGGMCGGLQMLLNNGIY